MESWSASLDSFKVKVFLDTNILCYLVDNTYPALTSFIKTLSEMPVVDLISSEYVLAEFIGVRKQENYFQEALKEAKKQNITLNLSSFLKYNKRYDIPNLKYDTLQEAVNCAVTNDERSITNDFNISFQCGFNKNLIKPTKEICLCSRISREDSLVMVSSIYKSNDEIIKDKVIILTNDDDFYSWYCESQPSIDAIFSEIGNIPNLVKIANITNSRGQKIDLTNQGIEDSSAFCISYIKDLIFNSFGELYKGQSVDMNCPAAPNNCVGIKVKATQFESESYCIVIGAKLDFLYCIPHPIALYHCKKPVDKVFIPQQREDKASFILDLSKDSSFDDKDQQYKDAVINKIKEPNNLIFLHPDWEPKE